jgi:S1-C subfamily serine protease
MQNHTNATGSGVIIKGNLILTNAHVVSDSTNILVQKENDPEKFAAEVLFIAHECDLALLIVSDTSFFEGTNIIELSTIIPDLESTVVTYGYPTGGSRISITKGIISRIENRVYSHSGYSFLTVQTDAAINEGNSGGPVIQDDKIVGIAFQIISDAESIGYMIPTTVINHFLSDIEDNFYAGFPQIWFNLSTLENEDFRNFLEMDNSLTGIIVTNISNDTEDNIHLQDIILKIDGIDVANDGSIPFGTGRILVTELFSSKQFGEYINFEILRDGEIINFDIELVKHSDRIENNNTYESLPKYFIFAGIVFQPLSLDYLKTWKDWYYNADKRMLYYYYYNYKDQLFPEREEFIIINHVLPDSVNTYISSVDDKVVNTVNNIIINNFDDLIEAFEHPVNGYHIITLDNDYKPLVIKAENLEEANVRILNNYNIPEDRMLD